MENKNSKMDSSDILSAIKEDEVFKTVCLNVCYTSIKIANYIDKFEDRLTDWEDDIACLTVNNKYFTDIEQLYIGNFTKDVIYVYNMNKPKFELINIELRDDYTILLLSLK